MLFVAALGVPPHMRYDDGDEIFAPRPWEDVDSGAREVDIGEQQAGESRPKTHDPHTSYVNTDKDPSIKVLERDLTTSELANPVSHTENGYSNPKGGDWCMSHEEKLRDLIADAHVCVNNIDCACRRHAFCNC
eukprot:IDg16227t1